MGVRVHTEGVGGGSNPTASARSAPLTRSAARARSARLTVTPICASECQFAYKISSVLAHLYWVTSASALRAQSGVSASALRAQFSASALRAQFSASSVSGPRTASHNTQPACSSTAMGSQNGIDLSNLGALLVCGEKLLSLRLVLRSTQLLLRGHFERLAAQATVPDPLLAD